MVHWRELFLADGRKFENGPDVMGGDKVLIAVKEHGSSRNKRMKKERRQPRSICSRLSSLSLPPNTSRPIIHITIKRLIAHHLVPPFHMFLAAILSRERPPVLIQ